MDPLVSVLVTVRRRAREALPFAGVMLLGAAVALHAMHPLGVVGFGALTVLLGALIAARIWHRNRTLEQRTWLDIEIGTLLVVAAFAAVVEIDGALDGRCYPLVCLAVAIVSAFASPAASLTVVGVALGFELGLWRLAYGTPSYASFGPHVGFLTVFALKNYRFRTRMEAITKHVPRADARWLGQRLSLLTDDQIRDGFRAGGYGAPDVEALTSAIRARISALAGL